jgi:UBX domain-containing protein 1
MISLPKPKRKHNPISHTLHLPSLTLDRNSSRPDPASSSASQSSHFRGGGQTLGGDGVVSRAVPDPYAAPPGAERRPASTSEPVERVLHLWQDGFSIDDGELHRFDDPANARELNMIRQGRAPMHLMNVSYDQQVDVKLQRHEENWRPLPKKYRPFGGAGRRLGSPVPGDSNSAVAPPPPVTTTTTTTRSSSAATTTTTTTTPSNVDESRPTLMLRIQMPDGTRLPARFNTTQTVGDVYQFVQRASTDTSTRPWVLATTFPNKEHTDRSLVLGEMAEFKKGGTAVVKRLLR